MHINVCIPVTITHVKENRKKFFLKQILLFYICARVGVQKPLLDKKKYRLIWASECLMFNAKWKQFPYCMYHGDK